MRELEIIYWMWIYFISLQFPIKRSDPNKWYAKLLYALAIGILWPCRTWILSYFFVYFVFFFVAFTFILVNVTYLNDDDHLRRNRETRMRYFLFNPFNRYHAIIDCFNLTNQKHNCNLLFLTKTERFRF